MDPMQAREAFCGYLLEQGLCPDREAALVGR